MQQNVFRIVVAVVLIGGVGLVSHAAGPNDTPPPVPVSPVILPPQVPARPLLRFPQLLPDTVGFNGQPVANDGNSEKQLPESGPELTLGECIAVALERSPTLRAARASMAATQAGYRSLMNFGTVGTLISPDLNIRKQQAERGLAAAAADYQKVHNELVYDVTRLYYTAVYAGQQEGLAADVVDYLGAMVKLIRKILDEAKTKEELGGLNEGKYLTVRIGLAQAQELQQEARIGRQRALAALRQVMAVDPQTFPFRVKDTELPLMDQKAPITREKVIEEALCRRPELALAAAGVDVFRLEVYAQGKIPFRRVVPTFASGTDLHSKDVPQAVRTPKDYRPGGIIPEMPTQLVGSKFDRVCRAINFSEKADAVYQSARSLVTLDAENAFFELQLASEKLRFAAEKFKDGKELQKRTLEMADSVKEKDLLVQAYIVATKAQADYVTAVYEYILALAALERITAGGICPAFPGR